MKAPMKSKKGVMPAGMYADGGKVKGKDPLFTGKDTKAEEMAEAKAVRSGKVSPKEYVRREMAEEKREGEKPNKPMLEKRGKDLASGKMSAEKYGSMAKMADGGMVRASCHPAYGKNMKK